VKSNLPTATTIVSSQPPKAIATAVNASVPNTSGKQSSTEDVMIALAEPINTDISNVVNSKPGVALVKSEPLPPADRTIKVGTAAFSTIRLGDQQVEKCEVADPNICRAVVTTDGEVAFLPGKVGVTRATLWLKQKSGESKVETAEITVGEALATGSTASDDLEKLNSTLKDLYPGCELSAVAGDRCIEIRGEVDSEQQAKAVLQLVRKLCLVPVKDKVSVR
jgi:Flp pilus assembly secretin CpaC